MGVLRYLHLSLGSDCMAASSTSNRLSSVIGPIPIRVRLNSQPSVWPLVCYERYVLCRVQMKLTGIRHTQTQTNTYGERNLNVFETHTPRDGCFHLYTIDSIKTNSTAAGGLAAKITPTEWPERQLSQTERERLQRTESPPVLVEQW